MERQPVRSGGRATFQRAPNGPNGETRGARVHIVTTDEEFFGPTPNASHAAIPVLSTDEHAAAPTDSAGSDEGSDGGGNAARVARRPKTTAEKLEAVKLKALEEAKKGIVNVPRGSATKAKHGLAISLEEDEKRKQAEYDKKMLDAQVAAALKESQKPERKSSTKAFDVNQLADFLATDADVDDHWSDESEDDPTSNKYTDDDEVRSWFVLHPTTKLRRYWDFLQIFLLLYIAISVPYRIGFSEPSYGAWYMVDFFIDMYFYIDMVLNFFTAYWESGDDDDFHYVTSLWKIQKHYLKGWFLPDVISLLPIDYVSRLMDGTATCSWQSESACGAAAQTSSVPEGFRILKMIRLLRVLRAARIFERYQETLLRVYKWVTIARLVSALMLLSHWMACLYAYVYNFQREDASGEEGLKSEMYIAALFWSVQTLTTVGYGNVVPTTVDERLVAILVMIMGGFAFAAIISGVNMATDADSPGNRFAVLMNHVRELLASHKMPSGLKSRVTSHYKASNQPQKLVNRDIINPLPEAIRADVNFFIYGKAMAIGLKSSGLVDPAGIVIEILCRTMDTKIYTRGMRLCYPYELAENVIITLNGRISYSADEASGFFHSDVSKIKRRRLREQQIELAEEKGILRGPGTLLNPGLLSGFFKGILCAMPFDKAVEVLALRHESLFDMCVQHQQELLRNFEDEFLHTLQCLNKPKMVRIALSEANKRRFFEDESRNVCSNWRELLEEERVKEDGRRVEKERAGALAAVTSRSFNDSSGDLNRSATPGATMGAIKLSMQQMHADIVNISEQIQQVMVTARDTQITSQEAAAAVSKLILSNDVIEEKQLAMELNVEAVYQAVQNLASDSLNMEAGGWQASGGGGGNHRSFDFRPKDDGKGGGRGRQIGVAPYNVLQSDAIREKIEEAAKKGKKISITKHVDTDEQTWERERRPDVGIQGIRRTSQRETNDKRLHPTHSKAVKADHVFRDHL